MSNSLAPTTYSTISNDGAVSGSCGFIAQEIGSVLSDTITLTGGAGGASNYCYSTGSTVTISNGGYSIGNLGISGAGTISSISATQFNWKSPEEFVDAFPDYDRIEKMCKEYPGLAIAFEKFKTVYNLVKDHYDTPEDQRPKP
jgi:hypothetical protein